MTLPRAVVIAGAVFPTTYDSALLMLDDCLASFVRVVAAPTISGTSMAAGQNRGARRWAPEVLLGDIDGAFDVGGMLTAWDLFRHNNIATDALKV
jgi:hypothetical protein